MKRLLITGGTGFLGRHLCQHLLRLGHQLYLLVRPSSDTSSFVNEGDLIHFFEQDQMAHLFEGDESINLDGIIHVATDYGRHGEKDVVFDVNYQLPKSLLQLAINKEIPSFINIDSFSSLIKNYPYLPHYHASKNAFLAEAKRMITGLYPKSFSTLRLHHLYGTHDDDRKFIPFIIQSLLSNKESIDLTAGTQKRDFIFALDVVSAIETVLKSCPSGIQEYEVGNGQCYSIREFVESVKREAKNKTTTLNFGALPTRENELMVAVANNLDLIKLGWSPAYPLEQGIQATIDYYRDKMS